jgi:hypothetical protein
MNIPDQQEREDMAVFGEFAKMCPLPLLSNTAQNRPKPEPDILCDIESGEKLAFELGQCEDVTKDDAHPDAYSAILPKRLKDAMEFKNTLDRAYSEALAKGRIVEPERFKFHSVRVNLEAGFPSKNGRQKIARRVIELLNEKGQRRYTIKDVVRSIQCEQYSVPSPIEGPIFYVGSPCGARPYVVELIKDKLAKKYESNHRIHLLAWSTTACHAESEVWRDRLANFLKSNGMGQFERIWVFGSHEQSIVFDSAASSAG